MKNIVPERFRGLFVCFCSFFFRLATIIPNNMGSIEGLEEISTQFKFKQNTTIIIALIIPSI